MTWSIAFVLFLLLVALACFVKEWLPIEVTALGLVGALLASGLLTVEDAVAGFSNKAVIAIGALFVLSHALTKTGVLEVAADRMTRIGKHSPWLAVMILLCAVGVLSGFLNNTAVVAIFIPLTMDLCRRIDVSPSKVLIPLSYASIFGGTLTLIGTSTNLLVSAVTEEMGAPAFGMFEFTPLGAAMLVLGLAYVLLFARKLLPGTLGSGALTEKYKLDGYLTEVKVLEGSELAGQNPTEARIAEHYDTMVLAILRGKERYTTQIRRRKIVEGDVLIVEGSIENLVRMRKDLGVSLLSDKDLQDEEVAQEGRVMVEAIVAPVSGLVGQTLRLTDFRQHYGGFVLAIRRLGATLREKVADIPLQSADSLLLLIQRDRLDELRRSENLVVLSEIDIQLRRRRWWWLVLLVLPAVIVGAATGLMDIAASAMLGAIVLLIAGVLRPQEAYRAVEWPVIFMIAAFIPVGHVIIATGTADFLARGLLRVGQAFPENVAPFAVLSLVYFITSLLTQLVSNNAAAIIVAPLAFSLGEALGVDPRPFLVAVCFAASAEFMTPMGYQTNLMVYGPGNYRFLDYTRFGAPLNIGFWLLSSALIPVFWSF